MIAYAAAADVAKSFVDQINQIIVFPLIVLLSAVALLIFIWGGFQYVYNASESGAREEGRRHLIWGVIGLLIMVSAYSILEIAANTFKIDVEDSAQGIPSGGANFGASRPATTGQDSTIGGNSDTQASTGSLESRVRAEMAAAGVDSTNQDMRWVAMTVSNPPQRIDAVNAAFDLGYISAETKLSLLKEIQNQQR